MTPDAGTAAAHRAIEAVWRLESAEMQHPYHWKSINLLTHAEQLRPRDSR